jgi:hypothetical protein
MKTVLEFLFVVIKAIVVFAAIIVEFPIKLMATILFVILFIIMAFLAPIFSRITCPKWWEAYGDYAIKWKHNWRLVTWVLKNYDY